MKAFVVAIAGVLLASPALAQTSGGGMMSGSGAEMASDPVDIQENASTAEETETERRICRRVETATGSRMSYRRLCKTAREWREFHQQR